MMLLSGYTLGFFFPTRTKDLQAERLPNLAAIASATKADDAVDRLPAVAADRPEVPAPLYFHRYF